MKLIIKTSNWNLRAILIKAVSMNDTRYRLKRKPQITLLLLICYQFVYVCFGFVLLLLFFFLLSGLHEFARRCWSFRFIKHTNFLIYDKGLKIVSSDFISSLVDILIWNNHFRSILKKPPHYESDILMFAMYSSLKYY
jgi:hypothetical protein